MHLTPILTIIGCFMSITGAEMEKEQEQEKKIENLEKLNGELESKLVELQLKLAGTRYKDALLSSYKYLIDLQTETNSTSDSSCETRIKELQSACKDNLDAVQKLQPSRKTETPNQSLYLTRADLPDDFTENPTSCKMLRHHAGIQKIYLPDSSPIEVLCDNETSGAGWTVIQNRFKGTENFYRAWAEYREGFGSLDAEFFIGLDNLYRLTDYEPHELYIDLESYDGEIKYALYDNFAIGNETENYTLKSLGKMSGSGNAEDYLRSQENLSFTTFDRDNDNWTGGNLAVKYHGGWWYSEITASNLNGRYYKKKVEEVDSMHWGPSFAFKSSKMLIRPTN